MPVVRVKRPKSVALADSIGYKASMQTDSLVAQGLIGEVSTLASSSLVPL